MNEVDLERSVRALTKQIAQICYQKQSICIAFALMLVDPYTPEGIKWEMPVRVLGDRHDPIDELDKKRIIAAFQFLEKGIKMILVGEKDDIIIQ
jgi:hypothetical protein